MRSLNPRRGSLVHRGGVAARARVGRFLARHDRKRERLRLVLNRRVVQQALFALVLCNVALLTYYRKGGEQVSRSALFGELSARTVDACPLSVCSSVRFLRSNMWTR